MALDVSRIRSSYPALADGYAYLDGAAGTQVPSSVVEAISAAYLAGLGNAGGAFPASHRSGEIVRACRSAVADLVGGQPAGVVLGPNMTTLTYRFAETLSRSWAAGDEVVVSRLEHDANVRPWVQAAARAGAVVRWAEVDPATGELPADQYGGLLSDRTRLVAVTAASNLIGTRPDVAAILRESPRGRGPELCRRCARHSSWAGRRRRPRGRLLRDQRLQVVRPPRRRRRRQPGAPGRPAPRQAATGARVGRRRKFERGTLAFADLAGVAAAVDHLASLDGAAIGTRRERIVASMTAVEAYERTLFEPLVSGLGAMGHVNVYGGAPLRAPTAAFNVAGRRPGEVARHLAERRVNVWNGDNYAWELAGVLGIRDGGGAVRAGVVHYNDSSDVERLLEAVDELGNG